MRCTKIICTIGPSSCEPEMLKRLQQAGMNIARLNFSHADHDTHGEVIRRIRDLNQTLKYPVAIMLDTQGPEIRTGFNEVNLEVGDKLHITVPPTEEASNSEVKKLHVDYQYLIEEVKPGQSLSVDSGLVKLKVLSREDDHLHCEVIHGGFLKGRRHVNLPGVAVQLPSITAKDKEDLLFAKEMDLDGIALSFVRNADAVREAKEILGDESKGMKIIAKIENQEGVENMEQILEEADGIMVARGDLGLEVDMEELPQLQRRMAYLCAIHGKRLIVATHLLESMIEFPVPTRAEVTDVANAVYEQADAVMLSGETASGKYPIEAVETLDRIVRRTERYPGVDYASKMNLSSARMHLAAAAAQMASELQFKGFVAITQFGRGAEYISNMRPRGLPIYAFTNSERTYRTLLFCRSVYPFLVEDFSINPEFTLEQALRTLRDREGCQRGDQFMVLANILTAEGFVNSLQVRKIP